MAEVHVNVTSDKSGNQVVFHNPGQHPLPIGAGTPVTASVKAVGQPNGKVSGQVGGTSVVINNPA